MIIHDIQRVPVERNVVKDDHLITKGSTHNTIPATNACEVVIGSCFNNPGKFFELKKYNK